VAPDDSKPTYPLQIKTAGLMRAPRCVELLGGAALTWISHAIPSLTEFIMLAGMKGVCHKDPLILNLPELLWFGTANGVPNNTCGCGMNFINKDNAIYALEQYITFATDLLKKHPTQHVTSTVALRFSAKTPGILSFANNTEPYMWFEQPILDFENSLWPEVGSTPRIWDTLERLQELWLSNEKLKGRPHLGLWFNVETKPFRNHSQDQINTFIKYYQKFNFSKLFCNDFSRDLGFYKMAFKFFSLED
jgi:hypothetical protein